MSTSRSPCSVRKASSCAMSSLTVIRGFLSDNVAVERQVFPTVRDGDSVACDDEYLVPLPGVPDNRAFLRALRQLGERHACDDDDPIHKPNKRDIQPPNPVPVHVSPPADKSCATSQTRQTCRHPQTRTQYPQCSAASQCFADSKKFPNSVFDSRNIRNLTFFPFWVFLGARWFSLGFALKFL